MGRARKKVAMATSSQIQNRHGRGQRGKTPTSSQHATQNKTASSHSVPRMLTAIFSAILVPLIVIGWPYVFVNKPDSAAPPVPPGGDGEGDIVPHHQQVSLLKPYSADIHELLRVREVNMRKYSYNYSRTGVDKRSQLSLQEYRDVYDGKWPVIVTDVVTKWNAFNWSGDFLFQNYGQDRVTMKAVDNLVDQALSQVLPDIYAFTDDIAFDLDLQASRSQKNSLEQAVSLALPLELFYKNTHKAFPTRWTYVEDELFIPTRPELQKDIGDCEYLKEDFYQLFPSEVKPWDAMLLWGTKFSRSSLHMDPYNWTGTNAVLKGRKRWKLYPPGQDHLMYIASGRKSGFPLNCYKYNSPIDAYDADSVRYPLFSDTRSLEVDQLPGEMILIPTGWFHQAFNIEETLAISSQVMNRNNVRIVIEEIIKVGNLPRSSLPPNIDTLSPSEQVQTIMSLLPKSVIDRGREVTRDALYQINNGYKDKHYQLPLD